SLHSPAPQTFAELISVASKASLSSIGSNSQATALGGTSRRSTAAAASSQRVLGIPASNRRLTTIHAPRGTRSTSSDAGDPAHREWMTRCCFRLGGALALARRCTAPFHAKQ